MEVLTFGDIMSASLVRDISFNCDHREEQMICSLLHY